MSTTFLAKIPGFIRGALSEQDGLPSSKRLCFVATVAAGLMLLTFDVAAHRGLRSESISLFGMILGATATAVGIGMFAK